MALGVMGHHSHGGPSAAQPPLGQKGKRSQARSRPSWGLPFLPTHGRPTVAPGSGLTIISLAEGLMKGGSAVSLDETPRGSCLSPTATTTSLAQGLVEGGPDVSLDETAPADLAEHD